jgi:hypothetical protein
MKRFKVFYLSFIGLFFLAIFPSITFANSNGTNIEQFEYILLIEDSVKAYDQSFSIHAYLEKGQEFKLIEEQENWYIVDIGGQRCFIEKNSAQKSDGSTITNTVTDVKNIKEISMIRDVSVYDSENKQSIMGILLKDRNYSFYEESDSGYFISFGGRKGFIDKKDTVRDFLPTDSFFTVTSAKQPVYIQKSGKMVQKGYLVGGQEFKRIKGNTYWHSIQYGNETGYVRIEGTIPSDGQNFKPTQFHNKKVYLSTLENAVIYTSPSLQASTMAILPKAETYPIFSREGSWFVIQYGGRIGYIHPKHAKTKYEDVVNSNSTYTYEQMKADIEKLVIMYPGLIKKEVIGKSVDGRDIYAFKVGTGTKEIMLNGSHHAREHMTTNLLMEMANQYALSFAKGTNYGSYNTRQVLSKVSIWFVPMVNPDGVTLVQKGHTSAKNPSYVLKLNEGKKDFSSWKANIHGVDLNRQYPVNWNAIKGPKGPAPENFKGYKPLSEPEVLALVNFTRNHTFKTTASYHSSGEILFWYYGQKGSAYNRDYAIAKKISYLTGYSLVAPKLSSTSGGGYKDWFITEMKMPGFTPEIAPYVGKRPVPNSYFPSIWKENSRVGLMLASEASRF